LLPDVVRLPIASVPSQISLGIKTDFEDCGDISLGPAEQNRVARNILVLQVTLHIKAIAKVELIP
jgi:hypothetical protein